MEPETHAPLLTPEQQDAVDYGKARVAPGWTIWFAGPPGGLMFLVAAIGGMAFLYSTSGPDLNYFSLHVTFACFFVVVAAYLVQVGMRLVLSLSGSVFPRSRSGWNWFWMPALWVLLIVLVYDDVPLRVRFSLSRPAMDQLVRDVKNARGPIPDRRVGLYQAIGIEHLPGGGVRFAVEGSGFADRAGFVYLPPHAPRPRLRLRPVADCWYITSDF